MFLIVSVLATLLAVAAAAKDGRTFAVAHFYGQEPLTIGRMDPIIAPGVASGHVHLVQGRSGFALRMTDTSALDSNCTTAFVKNDKSNYWVPSLYFQDPKTGQFESAELFYMNIYYLYVSRLIFIVFLRLTAL
jgi:hypothetical protein